MNIFSKVDSGTTFHHSRFTKSISNTMRYDCRWHELIPVLKRFVLPGDVWRIGGDVLVRFQPMLTPSLTPCNFRVRYFFVPLRLLETDAETIITGSQNGHLYSGTLPVFKNFVDDADTNVHADVYKVKKWTLWDYMGIPTGDYSSIKTNACLPAQYWSKGYFRIFYDYYEDENVGPIHSTNPDFDTWWNTQKKYGALMSPQCSDLAKDYFTSALNFQLKGTAPRIDVTGSAMITPNYTNDLFFSPMGSPAVTKNLQVNYDANQSPIQGDLTVANPDAYAIPIANAAIKSYLNTPQPATVTQLGFTADDLRTMMAQTRIFERLARAGSRYTEYLRSNFGTAPADDTLQRAQYLGGWKVPIVTTEVLQTGEDGNNPVGTMRGHGITRGGNRINTFYAKEFGLLFGLAEIRPNVEYTQGIPRELTYKSRFEFFNPSLQHLSEQEIRNGELFVSFSDGLNDNTFGFQAYANELRSSHDETVGDLRDTLAFWTQSIEFSSRPNLDNAFLTGLSHMGSFNKPFQYLGSDARPCIVQFANRLDVYRPMVRYATPGLVDHL